jgi:DNA repair protein RecN (Recombination protein N)
MLKEIHLKNFALIEDAKIYFKRGLNILTGETGAGKTLIIQAINLLIGERADSAFIKEDKDSLVVQGFFELNDDRIVEFLKCEKLIEVEGFHDEIVLTREVNRKGKNRAFINGLFTSVSNLKKIGRLFIDIHGQHEHQYLLDPGTHINIIDRLGKKEISGPLKLYKELLIKYKEVEKEIEDIKSQADKKDAVLEDLRYRVNEIENLNFKEEEDSELENQKNILKNSENIYKYSRECLNILDGESNGYNLIDTFSLLEKNIGELSFIDKGLSKYSEEIGNFNILLSEINTYLKNYLDDFDFNPQRLESIQERLFSLNELKKKYSSSLREILGRKEILKEEISSLEQIDEHLGEKIQDLKGLKDKLIHAAVILSSSREKTALVFERQIVKELKDLRFKYIDFKVKISSEIKDTDISKMNLGKKGADDIEFLISLNKGEGLRPLAKVSSGGEVSRVMLAIKSIISKVDDISVMVFDEIDSGIGGEAAMVVGQKLYKISLDKQVFCITHLAQLACFADSHFHIDKYLDNDKTKIRIMELGKEKTLKEISRMLSGRKESDISLMHSEDMIKQCDLIKGKIKKGE